MTITFIRRLTPPAPPNKNRQIPINVYIKFGMNLSITVEMVLAVQNTKNLRAAGKK